MEEQCECTQYKVCVFCWARQKKREDEAFLYARKAVSDAITDLFGPKPTSDNEETAHQGDPLGKMLDRIFSLDRLN